MCTVMRVLAHDIIEQIEKNGMTLIVINKCDFDFVKQQQSFIIIQQ